MRRYSTRLRPVRLSCGVLTLILVLSTTLVAQTESTKKAAPPPDTSPLSRYAPRENLFFYAEFAGLDSHQEAWHKTAAYKMLNETTLGEMLEEIGAQVFERGLQGIPDRRVTGRELVQTLEHLARSGFALGAARVPDHPAKKIAFLVVRGAAKKDVRPVFSRLLLMSGGPLTKPELVKRPSGRQVVIMKRGKGEAPSWTWWAEKDDVVITWNSPESADVLAEVIDGKRANAVEHPVRAELQKNDEGLEPVGLAFLEPNEWEPTGPFAEQVKASGVGRIDYRWGFAGDALMTVARLQSKAPRKGLLALLDQPTFDTKSLPSMPDGVTAFTAVSLNPAKVFDIVTETLKPANPVAAEAIDRAVETLRTKARVQLRKDVLAHLGPKAVLYIPPATSSSATARIGLGSGESGAGGLNPLARLMATSTVPRFVFISEIDDRKAFERSLDDLMIYFNKEMRAFVQAKADEARAAAPATENPGEPEEDTGRRRRPEVPAAPEFKMTPGDVKSFVLNVPSELGKLPAGFRPTIRVGAKHVVFASSSELARVALEVKKEASWIPADDQASAMQHLAGNLVYLQFDDPREQMPKLLASLPGELQKRINAALIMSPLPTATGASNTGPAAGGAPAAPGQPAAPGAAVAPGPASESEASAPTGAVGAPGGPGAPGEPGVPGAEGAARPASPGLVLRIAPDKLPSESALKALLFPGTVAASVTDQEVRYVSRVAFPTLIEADTLANKMLSLMIQRSIQGSLAAAAQRMAPAPADGAAAGAR